MIGDRAVASVLKAVADAGFAGEVLHQDYGDDVLVQTSHEGHMDASRLWIQVKGTSNMASHARRDGYAYSVPFDHAIRWIRTADLVVVVLWDLQAGVGYFSLPKEQVRQWDRVDKGHRTTTLRFDQANVFDQEAVNRLAWQSRIARYQALMLAAEEGERNAQQLSAMDPARWHSQAVMTALDFLRLLGIVERREGPPEEWRISPAARQSFLEEFDRVVDDSDIDGSVHGAAFATILKHAGICCEGLGLPPILIARPGQILISALGLRDLLRAREA